MRALLLLSAASAALAVCDSAEAQGASVNAARRPQSIVLDEIVVTATKRDEYLQDIGQAVTALTGAQLGARGIDDLEGLQFQIPNFNMGQQLGAPRISLRGVGLDNLSAAAEGSIAFHGDGVFYSRPAAALSRLLGTYYFVERVDGFFDVPLSSAIFGLHPAYLAEGYYAGGRVDTTAYAVFGEVARSLTNHFSVTLGTRYSYEEKRGQDRFRFDVVTPNVPGPGVDMAPILAAPSDNFSAFTPRVLLEYEFGKDRLAYASASRGFKSGSINLGGLQHPVRPELVWAYEVGVKADTFNRRFRTDLTGFYYDYTDLQVGQVRNNVLVLENAATAAIYGLEAEMIAAPTDHLRFDVVASYLHSEYIDFITQDQARPGQGNVIDPATGNRAFQLAGNRLAQAPEFSINVGAQYAWTTGLGDFSLRGEVFWVDDLYFTPFNLRSSMQRAHSKQNAFLNWTAPQGAWRGQIFVCNIDNDNDLGNVFVSSTLVGSAVIGNYQEPRTFGASLTYEF